MVRIGHGRRMVPIPVFLWKLLVRLAARKARGGLGFLTDDHRAVRDLAVLELLRAGAPLSPATIAERTGLSAERVVVVLGELERHMTFLFRSRGEAVTWAYPVTVDRTPHRARTQLGEEAFSP